MLHMPHLEAQRCLLIFLDCFPVKKLNEVLLCDDLNFFKNEIAKYYTDITCHGRNCFDIKRKIFILVR